MTDEEAGVAVVHQAAEDLDAAVHDLAQPLTALAFLTEVGLLHPDPAEWRSSLEAAARETKRAMERLRLLRDAAARLAELTGVIGGSGAALGARLQAAGSTTLHPAVVQAKLAARRSH